MTDTKISVATARANPTGIERLPMALVGDPTAYYLTLDAIVAQARAHDYIVVDASGRGDYTTLTLALAAASAGDIIYIASDIDESGAPQWVIAQDQTIIIGPGVVITHDPAGTNIGLLVDGGGAGITAKIYGTGGSVFTGNPQGGDGFDVAGANDTFILENLSICPDTSGNPIVMRLASQTVRANYVQFGGPGATWGFFTFAPLASGSILRFCGFRGAGGAASNVAYANAPFYHCSFENGIVNITFAAGNNSNVSY